MKMQFVLKPGFPKIIALGLVGLVTLLAVGLVIVWHPWSSPVQAEKPGTTWVMPTNPAIEEKWGIRIKQIGVTADGGLVDFRFVVLDPEKARNMMSNEDNLPVLIPDASDKIVNSAALMPAKHDLNPGQTYFLLYRNTAGAVKHDSYVSVVFSGSDLRLDKAVVK
jgi:hypothetical protein